LYKYGKKIWDKLNDKMNPEFEDETPVNPFDLWEGANFKIKIRKIDGFSNYDKSEFENPAPLDEDETKMETVWKTEHSLEEFNDPKNFKTFADLKEKLDRVLGLSTDTTETFGTGPEAPRNPSVPFEGGSPYIPKDAVSPTPTGAAEETEEEMSYFKQLAED
jgi:hypothetical protein